MHRSNFFVTDQQRKRKSAPLTHSLWQSQINLFVTTRSFPWQLETWVVWASVAPGSVLVMMCSDPVSETCTQRSVAWLSWCCDFGFACSQTNTWLARPTVHLRAQVPPFPLPLGTGTPNDRSTTCWGFPRLSRATCAWSDDLIQNLIRKP